MKYQRSSAVFKTPENGMVEKNNLHKCCLISTFKIVLDLAIISREWIGRGIQFHLKHFHDFFNTVLECVARRDTQCQRERCTIYAIIFTTPERKNYTASIKFETVQIEISGRNTLRERPLY